MEINQPLYVCFLDYNKAFDRVRHDHFVHLLEKESHPHYIQPLLQSKCNREGRKLVIE